MATAHGHARRRVRGAHRGAAGLVDRSERGKLLLTGAEAKDFLHGQVTNDVLGLTPGTGCYAAFLTHKGKMVGDMRVLDGGDAGCGSTRSAPPCRSCST